MNWKTLDNKIKHEKIVLDGKEIINIPLSLIDFDILMLSHGETVRFITENLKDMNLEILVRKIET